MVKANDIQENSDLNILQGILFLPLDICFRTLAKAGYKTRSQVSIKKK
jgi:hypothetical protein